ncbi:MAG: hypothetical protein HRU32_02410 [Rhodobacteraceae bacterium]|nr:hypothetical protein [Paracoccaceae bacterium]
MNPVLQRFYALCQSLMSRSGRIEAQHVISQDFGAVADWLLLLGPGSAPGTFVYSHYGQSIADHYGRDMTGQTTADFGGHIGVFFGALYQAAAERGEWVLSEHEPPKSVFVRRWHRLIVPLYTGDKVTHFAVANVPENELKTGLDLMVDPVFLCSADQQIHYANKAALEFFSEVPRAVNAGHLARITGISLAHLPGPDEMVARQVSQDSIELVSRGAIVERLEMTVSAATHRGESFYIVVMRLTGT